jgi:transposase
MPDTRTILPDTEILKLLHVHASGEEHHALAARTTSAKARCPEYVPRVCGMVSRRVHSRYVRMLADLPWQGIPVRVRLHLRRFFCDERSCERAIFTVNSCPELFTILRSTNRAVG